MTDRDDSFKTKLIDKGEDFIYFLKIFVVIIISLSIIVLGLYLFISYINSTCPGICGLPVGLVLPVFKL